MSEKGVARRYTVQCACCASKRSSSVVFLVGRRSTRGTPNRRYRLAMEFLRIAWGSLALLILLTCAPHMPSAIGARREEYDEPEEPDYGEEDEEEQDRDDQYGDEENGGEEEGEDMLVLPPVPADSCFRKDNTSKECFSEYFMLLCSDCPTDLAAPNLDTLQSRSVFLLFLYRRLLDSH